MKIELQNINKSYKNNTPVLKDISLTIEDSEMMVILGPSGCGKTTLLRIIAGLINIDSGDILFNGVSIKSIPAQKRNTAMVFQNYALFPHLNVFDNIAFGLKIRKISRNEILRMVNEILEITQLIGLEKRNIQELSGGQRQRVALARAIVTKPYVLLFDEPLSNLDEQLRSSMRKNIKNIQKQFAITSVYVTHDREEAMSISDRITIMNNGSILQTDTAEKIYNFPKNNFVAEFVGNVNLFEVNDSYINIFGKSIKTPYKNNTIYAMIRPENIKLEKIDKDNIEKKFTVIEIEYLGLMIRYKIKIDDNIILADSFNRIGENKIKVGDSVDLKFDNEAIIFTDKY